MTAFPPRDPNQTYTHTKIHPITTTQDTYERTNNVVAPDFESLFCEYD